MPQIPKLRTTNTSGYVGVSWSRAAKKWCARIRGNGHYRHLGLFETVEEAHTAYVAAALVQRAPDPSPDELRPVLLARVRDLYDEHGAQALSTRFLHRQPGRLYFLLRRCGLTQPEFLRELGLSDVFAAWRERNRKYRGVTKPKWSWDEAIARAKEVVEREGSLPTLEWFRHKDNGLVSFASAIFKTGHTWQDLRDAVGDPSTGRFVESRNRMRWRSRPEACVSDFLYARGVEHIPGRRYAEGYSEHSDRRYGIYDMHFRLKDGDWVDVEIWGGLDAISDGRYGDTRARKEAWHASSLRFLGIEHADCMSDARLTEILRPFIGEIAPFQFERPHDHVIQTSRWSGADELLAECARFAKQMPDGIFPSEDWLRKRGKYAEREGEAYNTLVAYVNSWLGGTRNVRAFLGQSDASTTKWSAEMAVAKWKEFEAKYGMTPSQCLSAARRKGSPRDVVNEASAIYAAATRHGVRDLAREGRTARASKWTRENTVAAWMAFMDTHGAEPSHFMSASKRRSLPRAITDHATRIYGAAARLGLLEQLRKGDSA
mgnify:CR=1 FL=1